MTRWAMVADLRRCVGCQTCTASCRHANATKRQDDSRRAVATKCTFCVDRIDDGLANGLKPGIDPEATPACVNACITQALSFGDLDDPQSNVSRLVAQNRHFRMHEELGTGPGFYYLWDANENPREPA